jgi:glyoxylase-like metal-dependent hydrolase (beta-lactamase superfamily II)
MLTYRLVYSPIDVNTYIITDGSGDCAVIDCGCYDDNEFAMFVSFLNEKNLNPVLLLNTHCHLDHVFGNRYMLEKYNLRPWSCELDEPNRKNASHHATLFGLLMDEPPYPGHFINDGDFITMGSISLKALHVPGHTAGSLAFYSEENESVFTGDALFSGSIGRTDLPGGNYETLINSINTRLFTLPPSTVVNSGHGCETTIGKELMTNPFFNR